VTRDEIEELRSAMRLTKEQFASEVGVVVRTVYRWLSEQKQPSPLALLRLRQLRMEYQEVINAQRKLETRRKRLSFRLVDNEEEGG